MKKRVWILVALLCIVAFTGGVLAKTVIQKIEAELRPDFTVVIDGKTQVFKNVNGEEVYPILYDGTTYLPLRAVGEIMDKVVYWYEDDKKIELKKPTTVTDADVIVAGRQKEEAAQTETQNKIEAEEAKQIALQKAGFTAEEVVFERTELEKEKGIYYYDIEFKTGGVEYEAHIGAAEGEILKWEIDYDRDDKKIVEARGLIGEEEAKKIALADAEIQGNSVDFKKVKLDEDDGVFRYEIEFRHEGLEYEYEIHAETGAIIEKDLD